MNPIINSTIKEQMRRRNESMAQSRENQIRSQLTANLNRLTYKKNMSSLLLGLVEVFLG